MVCNFKQPFSVFKQHFTHFNALFHPHVFLQMFSNNNFQFLNTCTKRALSVFFLKIQIWIWVFEILFHAWAKTLGLSLLSEIYDSVPYALLSNKKRYLIVLDDVCHIHERLNWHCIWSGFHYLVALIFTTRLSKVAKQMAGDNII